MIPVAVGVTAVVFFLIHLVPGDPARAILGPRAPEERIQALHEEWGLDEPLPAQFVLFVSKLAQGDLGNSLIYNEPAGELIASRLPVTLLLLVFATILTVLISLPLATLGAVRANRLPDHVVRAIPLLGLGMPAFWVGIMLMMIFAVELRLFPVGGYGQTLPDQLRATFLPALTVALAIMPVTVRSLRAALIEVLTADYIATARAKGLSGWRVLIHHALRNSIIPTIVVLGVSVGWLVGNTLVVERVFALPGIGALMINSIVIRDFPVVQGITFVVAILVVLVNLATDLVHAKLDPRVRLG